MNPIKRLRCAVYTRKSTEEGLDQEYTSIDAQRDAGHAYIASRRSEGWIPVGDDYDDGGFSGCTLVRPALQRLIADIEAGKVEVVVAYKLDRLSRSLFDFAELVKLLDRHGVTFVSVTQQFNTTDAMGRMLLNILLTFAQFERELTAERIRDKFTASKKKGLWMHGIAPLGYDIVDRRLAINPAEAEQVRWIFHRFLERGSLMKVVQDVRALRWTSKAWTTKDERQRPVRLHDRTTIHTILHNRAYLGELKHRDVFYQDTHPPLIERAVWDEVHALLQVNGRTRAGTERAKVAFLPEGPRGRSGRPGADAVAHHQARQRTSLPLLPEHPRHSRGQRRLGPAAPAGGGAGGRCGRPTATGSAGAGHDRGGHSLGHRTRSHAGRSPGDCGHDAGRPDLETTLSGRAAAVVRLLVERVVVSATSLEVRLRPCGIEALAKEFRPTTTAEAA